MRMIAATVAVLLALLPASGSTCTLVMDSQLSQADLRTQFRRSAHVVEVVAIGGSNWRSDRPGLVRVERVYKGHLATGIWLPVFGSHPALCGAGDIHVGERGVLMLGNLRHRPHFYGFVSPNRLVRLRQMGLLPPN